jgi:hypothetical protein
MNGTSNNDMYAIELDARVHWAHHKVCSVAQDAAGAEWHLGWSLKLAKRCGEIAALDELDLPKLLSDEPLLANAWRSTFSARRLEILKLRSREGLDEWLGEMASSARRGCGLSYELFVKRFSEMVDEALDLVDPVYQQLAIEIASSHGYATAKDLDEMQDEIEASGGCSLTGIDPWCCPCGRHE